MIENSKNSKAYLFKTNIKNLSSASHSYFRTKLKKKIVQVQKRWSLNFGLACSETKPIENEPQSDSFEATLNQKFSIY